jgi:ATP-binding cassette subfamily B protein
MRLGEGGLVTRHTWRYLASHVAHFRGKVFGVGGLAAVAGLVEAFVLVVVVRSSVMTTAQGASLNDTISVGPLNADARALLVASIACAVVLICLNACIAWMSSAISADALRSSRSQMLRIYGDAAWPAQSVEREGSLQESVASHAMQTSTLALFFTQSIASGLSLAVLLLAAATVDLFVTAIVAGAGVIISLVIRPIGRLTRARSEAFTDSNSSLSEDVARFASMSLELKAFGVTGKALEDIERANIGVAHELQRARFVGRFGGSLYKDLAIAFLIIGVIALGFAGSERAATVAAVVLLVVRALSYATQLQGGLQQLNQQYPNLAALDRKISRLHLAVPTYGSESPTELRVLSVEDVSYCYPGFPNRVLNGIDLLVRPGDIIGITGASGGGKSTLLSILLRLRVPNDGIVRWNGVPIDRITSDSWSRLVAIVPQEPALVEGSIADNIRFYRDASVERIGDAAERAQILREIVDLESQFETRLGPRGGGLSGGQKQRIALARALLGRPRLLLLDEPTSALDPTNEAGFLEAIKSIGPEVAIIIVSHRPRALDLCQRVYRMDNGRLEIVPRLSTS